MTITSGLNSGLPAAPLATDPVLNGELQIIYNTLRNIIQALNDAGIPSGGITPSATILPVVNGGTGIATATGLLKGNGTAAMSAVATSSTVGQVLRVTGANTYVWGAVNLADTDAITGNLPVTNLNAGTGATALTFWRGDGAWGVPAGAGDVVGPAGATGNNVVLFDGATGKIIKDGGTLGSAAYTSSAAYDAAGAAAAAQAAAIAASQPLDTDLSAIAALVSAADKLPYATGAGTWTLTSFTTAGRALIDDVDATAQRVTLGLVIGTDVQAYDADLTTWAGITPGTGVGTALAVNVGSAGAFVTFNGALGTPSSGTLTNATGLPAAGVVGTALVSAAIGTTVQAYDADLTTWAGVTPGTGVATALAVNVGSAGAVVLFNGAGGTPSSMTGTNITGIPAAGVTGTALVAAAIGTTVQAYDADLVTWAGITPGTGVATALAIPTGTAGSFLVNGASFIGTQTFTGVINKTLAAATVYSATVGSRYDRQIINSTTGTDTFVCDAKGNTGNAIVNTMVVQNASGYGDWVLQGYNGAYFEMIRVTSAGVLTLPFTVAGAAVATQANQETATSVGTIVTPGRQHHHPSAAKAWAQFNTVPATPTLDAAYNIASLTDSGTGLTVVNFTTAFSSAYYACGVAFENQTSNTGASLSMPAKLAGSVTLYKIENATPTDCNRQCVVCFGDQ